MRIQRVAAALAALTVLVAGCGGGDDQSSSAADGGSAQGPTVEEATETPTTPTPTTEEAPADSDVDAAAFAQELLAAQQAAGTAHIEAELVQGIGMHGVMRVLPDDTAFDLTMHGEAFGGEARVIFVDQVMYLQMPQARGKYLKLDTRDPSNPLAAQMLQMDPSRTFEGFKAITSFERKGTERVGGVGTTRYAVTVDTAKALEAQGMDPAQAAGAPEEISYEMWVGDDDLIRKIVMGPELGGMQMTLSRWGEPVRIQAPPPGQITEMGPTTG